MNTCLFRNVSVPVRISLVPYKCVPIYMYSCYEYVLDTYPYICTVVNITFYSNSFEFDSKFLMFEFVLSIRVSFVLVGADRIRRRCTATKTLLLDRQVKFSIFPGHFKDPFRLFLVSESLLSRWMIETGE